MRKLPLDICHLPYVAPSLYFPIPAHARFFSRLLLHFGLLNIDAIKTLSLLLAALVFCAALHWLIGVVQRRLARRLDLADQQSPGSPPSLKRLLFDWACNALRTAVWFLCFTLIVNLAPQARTGFDSFGEHLIRIRDGLVAWLLDRGINLVVVLVVTIFLMRFASALVRAGSAILERGAANREEVAARRRLQTLSAIFRGVAQAIIFFIGLMIFLQTLGANITPILASAGVVGIAIGFGAQSLIKDIFGGILILLEDQFSVGDTVKIGEVSGAVEQLTLRATRVRSLDGSLTTIPNGAISTISNFSKGWSRAVLDIEIDYDEDIDRAMRVMSEAAQQMRQEHPEQITEEPSMQGVDRLSHSAITLRLTAKTAPNKQADVARELRRRIKLAFEREGIKVPSTRQQLILMNERSIDPQHNRD
jgi:small conductance mechanosensitive channel